MVINDLFPVVALTLHDRMDHMLKKLPFLKKKDSKESQPQISNNDLRQWDSQEGHFSGSRPSSTSATQRTTQVLPLLVKSSAVPTEVRKKSQPSALPDLSTKTSPKSSPHMEIKHSLKETTPLPKGHEKEKIQGRRRSPDAVLPLYPELSDECFRSLWESKRPLKGKPVKEALDLMDEREILDTILDHLHASQISADHKQAKWKTSVSSPANQKPSIQQSTSQVLSKDKINLYKYYGVKLRNSRQKDLVENQLKNLLRFSCQEETDREGISETIHMAAFCHLPEILVALKDASSHMQPKRSSLTEATIEVRPEMGAQNQARMMLILCYGQAVLGAQTEDMIPAMDEIVTEILGLYSTKNKDEGLKKAFMRSVIMITKAFAHNRRQDIPLPHKQELIKNIIEVIEDQPTKALSIVLLHQAIVTITCISRMKPALNSEARCKVVSKSIQNVFSLPAFKMTILKAGSPTQSSLTQDFYHQTATACNTMLTGLVSEEPNLDALQDILLHTNPWIESPKTHERERAIKSTKHLLKFVSENVNFDTTAEFFLLGELVALLALHIGDTSEEVAQMSAEAAYHLHHLIMSKMANEMVKKPNKKGNIVKWLREDFFVSGPGIFSNNIPKMAKAFAEHLTSSQITELILKALKRLTHSDKNISQAAGQLLGSIMEEYGIDMEELPMILKDMYQSLPKITDPTTKEQTIKSICHLASRRVNRVVDILLECSVDCDDSSKEIWRALVADPYANMKIMKPLLKRLQDQDPNTEEVGRRNSKSTMPIAATNVLSYILSLPEAPETLQNKFPSLLIALVTQLYFLLGASKSRKSSKASDISEHITYLSTTVQAIKNLITCAGYHEEFNDLGKVGCWDMLLSPNTLFEGIFHLVRTLFTFSKTELKVMFRQANTYLRRPDLREKTIGMVFFSELLYHPEVGHFFMMQDIVDVLNQWMTQPYPLIQIFSIRGLGYLLQHPFENKMLEPVLSPVVNCAGHPDKNVAKEALRTLHFLFRHLDVEIYGWRAINLIPHLLKYFADEDIELRNTSITIFGMLLKGVKDTQSSVTENVLQSFVPLIVQLANGRSKEVSRSTIESCVTFLNWRDVPISLFDHQIYSSLHSMYANICFVVMNKCREHISEMLYQMVEFLRSRNPTHREAAAILIACCAQYMTPDLVTSKQIEEVFLALRDLQGDPIALPAQAAAESMEEIVRHCGHRMNPDLIGQLSSRVSRTSTQTKQ
ncbi:maestro heat-like repeat family member 5 [Erythrolamprus reginae]|uniref:maestro heat-like repeat family member 5 n=1 Tax=Erythrolamprus reginae TaxID=121349 RepID=UPI00396CE541